MTTFGIHITPGSDPMGSPTVGSGTTEAADLAAMAPAADGHVCAVARPMTEVKFGGLAVRITDQGALGDGLTLGVSTLIGSLKVVNVDTGEDMSDELAVCDHTAGDLGVGVGSVLTLRGNTKTATAQPGQLVELVWVQAGEPLDGAVPQFQLLGWPLIAVNVDQF